MTATARFLTVISFLSSWTAMVLGAEWRPVELKFPKIGKPAALNITAIGIAAPDQVYLAASKSRFYLWNGTTLTEINHDESGNPDWDIRTIVINSPQDIWAFGDNGLSIKFDGERWQESRNTLTGTGKRKASIRAAACVGADLCFAGSQAGRLLRWDGKSWEEIQSPAGDARIYGIQLNAKDFGWMVGEGFLASWNGTKWTKAGLEDVPRLYGVVLIGRDWGWAVGDRGAFFEYDGNAWTPISVKGSLFRLRSIACNSKKHCWAVGEAGAVFAWNGAGWKRVRLGTVNRLTEVEMTDAKSLIGGDKTTLFELTE